MYINKITQIDTTIEVPLLRLLTTQVDNFKNLQSNSSAVNYDSTVR